MNEYDFDPAYGWNRYRDDYADYLHEQRIENMNRQLRDRENVERLFDHTDLEQDLAA